MSNRRELASLLDQGKLDEIAVMAEASSSVPSMLVSRLFAAEALTRWRAADAMGRACVQVGRREPSKVRLLLQRLVWALNDESGMTGWGVPQAIGEVIRSDAALAEEFLPLLLSYLDEEDVAVGTDVLVHGVIHAIGRTLEQQPALAGQAIPSLRGRLADADGTTRGLAAWALGRARAVEAAGQLEALCGDPAQAERYESGELLQTNVGAIAREALAATRT